MVAVDVAIRSGLEARRRDLVSRLEQLRGFTERVARLEGEPVGLDDGVVASELLLDPAHGNVHGAVVQVVHRPEREEVLAAIDGLGRKPGLQKRPAREPRELDRNDAVAVERAVLERVLRIIGLLEIDRTKRVGVDDQQTVRPQVPDVGLQRRGIHGHQDVGCVSGGEDVLGREVDLETRHSGEGSRRGPDLGREVRQGRQIVPDGCRRGGELRAGELHAVARVACESDHDAVELLDGFLGGGRGRLGFHSGRPFRILAGGGRFPFAGS